MVDLVKGIKYVPAVVKFPNVATIKEYRSVLVIVGSVVRVSKSKSSLGFRFLIICLLTVQMIIKEFSFKFTGPNFTMIPCRITSI